MHRKLTNMNAHLYLSFILTSLIVLVVPGPSFAYAIAVGMRSSRQVICRNALGMAFGGLTITLALAFGAAQLFASYPAAFVVLKIIGCTYLVALGIRTLFSRPEIKQACEKETSASPLLQGFIVETANPKTILFYASLVPQFADAKLGHMEVKLLILGATFVTLQVTWDVALMLGINRIGAIAGSLTSPKSQRIVNRISGTMFIALGLALLTQERLTS